MVADHPNQTIGSVSAYPSDRFHQLRRGHQTGGTDLLFDHFQRFGRPEDSCQSGKKMTKTERRPLTLWVITDTIKGDEAQHRQEFMPTLSHGPWTPAPYAETHTWFQQGKGIFTGAFRICPLCQDRKRVGISLQLQPPCFQEG